MKDEAREDWIRKKLETYLKDLAQFSQEEGKMTRLPFTQAAMDARDYLYDVMREIGLTAVKEENGAVRGILPGQRKQSIVIASHFDTVVDGGQYDGCLGVACGLVYAQMLIQEKITPEYTIEILATNDEEGVRFHTGYFTIKSMLGEVDAEYLHCHKDKDGISIWEAMKACGLSPEKIDSCRRDVSEIRHFMEIHIEQGPVLERSHKEIGIVDSIVGIRRYDGIVNGRADHAGTTPLNMRKDAVMKAARILLALKVRCEQYPGMVLTAGYLEVEPNAVNIVPEKVMFSLDIRSVKEEYLEEMDRYVRELAESDEEIHFRETLHQEPVIMNGPMCIQLEKAAEEAGYTFQHLYSGAGHDSLEAAAVWPTNMIFVPSRGGRSHCPEEYTDLKYAVKAVLLLKAAVQQIKETNHR